MNTERKQFVDSFNVLMIAPCGMNCAICIGHLREKKPCAGCMSDEPNKQKHCETCRLKRCEKMAALEQKYCYDCPKFPCASLRKLDTRYRTNYGMSMIENLENIRALGLDRFIELEKQRWQCSNCGKVICVHRESCITCGSPR